MNVFEIGQRLSYRGELCTVRYQGAVDGKSDSYLGVEWDDDTRGKHDGNHQRRYFKCRSDSKTCASFLKDNTVFDDVQSPCEALQSKYASSTHEEEVPVIIGGKLVEQVGFDKIRQQQSQLDELKIAILDHSRIYVKSLHHGQQGKDDQSLKKTSSNIVKLDLGYNLLSDFSQIEQIINGLCHLRFLSLEGNRFRSFTGHQCWDNVTELCLDYMALTCQELFNLLKHFPALLCLNAANNMLIRNDEMEPLNERMPDLGFLRELHLQRDGLQKYSEVITFCTGANALHTLDLNGNNIGMEELSKDNKKWRFPLTISKIDLSFNNISDWRNIDSLSEIFPGLAELLLTGNPIYEQQYRSPGRPFSKIEISMLVIARLPRLKSLNHTIISDKDRLNAETFYLMIIGQELSRLPDDCPASTITSLHPRYTALCNEYGEPSIIKSSHTKHDPNSIAARLINGHIKSSDSHDNNQYDGIIRIPQTFSLYNVHGLLSRRLNLSYTLFNLIWETGEKEPPAYIIAKRKVVEEWNSDDEFDCEGDDMNNDWVDREVELKPSTRPIGTIVDKKDIIIRIEKRS